MRDTAEGVANIEKRVASSIEGNRAGFVATKGLASCRWHIGDLEKIFLEVGEREDITKGMKLLVVWRKWYRKKKSGPGSKERKKKETADILDETNMNAVADNNVYLSQESNY